MGGSKPRECAPAGPSTRFEGGLTIRPCVRTRWGLRHPLRGSSRVRPTLRSIEPRAAQSSLPPRVSRRACAALTTQNSENRNPPWTSRTQRCTRHCATSGRELAEGESSFRPSSPKGPTCGGWTTPLKVGKARPRGPLPGGSRGCPRARLASRNWRTSDILELFANLEDVADKQEMRYVMALLLVRRRILRLEDTETDAHGREVLVLYCPRDESTHRVASVVPDEGRANEIQNELAGLLFAGAASRPLPRPRSPFASR